MPDKSPISLDSKVVLVTGGTRGIGLAIARASAAAGARVVVASRKQGGVDAAVAELQKAGADVIGVACHCGKPDEIDALFDKAADAFGGVDVLVNNAATNPYFGPMLGITDAAFDKTLEVNLKGYFWCIRTFVDRLRKRKAAGGAVVNVASVAGMRGALAQGVYGMSKAAVISMTQTLALELGSSGVRVNALAPGLIETQFASALTSNQQIADQVRKTAPLGRIGAPDDIAGAAVFLASDAASYITGHTLVIDGGLTVSAGLGV